MKRRDVVRALLTPETADMAPPGGDEPMRVGSHAVRAIGLEIGRLSEEAREAETLRQQIADGAVVVSLPTDLVDPSFVTDRLARIGDPAFRRLVGSIQEVGQQVPILVRPHPTLPGRYQIAYGHRRHAAATELGLSVKALVRPMSDAELVVAQGKENGERRDLSFIERALFAADLARHGFDRATLNRALGVHTAEMTRLLAVADKVPADLVRRIGPAPKAGRLRWLELTRELARAGMEAALRDLLDQAPLQTLSSDQRFAAVIHFLRNRGTPTTAAPATLTDAAGRPVVRIEHTPPGLRLAIDEQLAPGFGALVLEELPRLIERYAAAIR